jgi:hypothetical protein
MLVQDSVIVGEAWLFRQLLTQSFILDKQVRLTLH